MVKQSLVNSCGKIKQHEENKRTEINDKNRPQISNKELAALIHMHLTVPLFAEQYQAQFVIDEDQAINALKNFPEDATAKESDNDFFPSRVHVRFIAFYLTQSKSKLSEPLDVKVDQAEVLDELSIDSGKVLEALKSPDFLQGLALGVLFNAKSQIEGNETELKIVLKFIANKLALNSKAAANSVLLPSRMMEIRHFLHQLDGRDGKYSSGQFLGRKQSIDCMASHEQKRRAFSVFKTRKRKLERMPCSL